MKIKSIIADDNPFILDWLSDQLQERHPEVEVLGKAQNGAEALQLIKTLHPKLVFLDVEMPDMSGFEVLAQVENIDFQTIFITAHSHYAIKAIRFNALDYLVKPIDLKELGQAIRRFQSNGHALANQSQVLTALQNLKAENFQDQILFLPTQEGGLKLRLGDIVLLEGERNYSSIHLSNKKSKISSKTLGYFEEILTGKGFFRCHRSFIVNKAHIAQLKAGIFLLKNQVEIPISRRRMAEAKAWYAG